jgi:hypothetical protein
MSTQSTHKFNWIILGMTAVPCVKHTDCDLDDVVQRIEWQCEIYDSIDHSVHLEKGITELDVNGINPDNFTDFLELTKEQVCEWIDDIEDVENRLVQILAEWRQQPAPEEARAVELPWMKDCCPGGTGLQG